MERVMDVKELADEVEVVCEVNSWHIVKGERKVARAVALSGVEVERKGDFVYLKGKWKAVRKFMESGVFWQDYLNGWLGSVEFMHICWKAE